MHIHTACWFGQSSAQSCACNDTACRNRAMQNNPTQQMCCQWVDQVNNMDPQSLNDPRGTPLGFLQIEYRGTDSNLPDLCIRVNYPQPLRNIRYVVVSVSLVPCFDFIICHTVVIYYRWRHNHKYGRFIIHVIIAAYIHEQENTSIC